MKKIFTLIIVCFVYASMNAQFTWNVNDYEAQTIETEVKLGDVNAYGGSSTIIIEDRSSSPKTYDGVQYTKRMKLGGVGGWTAEGTPEYRVLSFAVTGDTDIKLICMSSNSSDTRSMNVYAGSNTTTVASFSEVGTSLSEYTLTYTGEATTIYVESTSGGINFYGIITSEASATAIDNPEISKNVVKTQYYGLNGVLVATSFEALPKGIYVKQEVYDDGTSKSFKISKTTAW